MKFSVECKADNARQYSGELPHSENYENYIGYYIDAYTEEAAILIGIRLLYHQFVVTLGMNADNDNDQEIIVYDNDGNVTEHYYDFRAVEIEE